jgi:hypothetical protein
MLCRYCRPSHWHRCRIARYDRARGRYRSPSWARGGCFGHSPQRALAEFITASQPAPPHGADPVRCPRRGRALYGVTVAATGVSLSLGVVGAVVGTFGGTSLRVRLVALFGEDHLYALIEDVIAILTFLLIVSVA